MIDAMLRLMNGIGFDEAIKIEDGDILELTIRKEDGERLELLRLPYVRVGDDGRREPCEPAFVRVRVDVAKGGRFETEEIKRKAAVEDEREACAKILRREAEYHRGKEAAAIGWESRAYHQVAAKTVERLEREIRARTNPPEPKDSVEGRFDPGGFWFP